MAEVASCAWECTSVVLVVQLCRANASFQGALCHALTIPIPYFSSGSVTSPNGRNFHQSHHKDPHRSFHTHPHGYPPPTSYNHQITRNVSSVSDQPYLPYRGDRVVVGGAGEAESRGWMSTFPRSESDNHALRSRSASMHSIEGVLAMEYTMPVLQPNGESPRASGDEGRVHVMTMNDSCVCECNR